MAEYVKLNKNITTFEWFQRHTPLVVYIALNCMANDEDGVDKGVSVKRGQVVTTLATLSATCGLTTSKIRTALMRLQKSGNISVETTNSYSVVTINDYCYADDNS